MSRPPAAPQPPPQPAAKTSTANPDGAFSLKDYFAKLKLADLADVILDFRISSINPLGALFFAVYAMMAISVSHSRRFWSGLTFFTALTVMLASIGGLISLLSDFVAGASIREIIAKAKNLANAPIVLALVLLVAAYSLGYLLGRTLLTKTRYDFYRACFKSLRGHQSANVQLGPTSQQSAVQQQQQTQPEPANDQIHIVPPAGTFEPRLLLKRSQRQAGMSGKNVIFMLDARMEVCGEHQEMIRKYKLGNKLVYDSASRKKHMERAQEHLNASNAENPSWFAPPAEQSKGLVKSLYKLGRAGVSAGLAALSLRVTIDSLIAGVHVECKDMNELLEAEDAMKEAGRNLKGFLSVSTTFDGSEEVVEL